MILTSLLGIKVNHPYFSKCRNMNRIKEVLKDKGISQPWLAKQTGKSYNTINKYARNERQSRLKGLYKIAEILSVDVKDLLKSKINV